MQFCRPANRRASFIRNDTYADRDSATYPFGQVGGSGGTV